MKKKLINPALADELREGSVFFRRRPSIETEKSPQPTASETPPAAPVAEVPTEQPEPEQQEHEIKQLISHDVEISRSHEIMTSRYHDSLIEDIRKAVKVVGRAPGTIRLTEQEKSHLTDAIYTLGRQGIRTSENEVYRIAINFLLEDWREHGKKSMLVRVLAALNA